MNIGAVLVAFAVGWLLATWATHRVMSVVVMRCPLCGTLVWEAKIEEIGTTGRAIVNLPTRPCECIPGPPWWGP